MRVCGSVFGVLFCSRPGLLVPLSSFYFVCVFIMGLKDPNLCLVCPPANIAPTGISCFAVSCLRVMRARHGQIPCPQRPPVPPQAPFPCPTMPLGPTIHIPPITAHLGHPLPSPTHYAWHDMLLPVLTYVACLFIVLARVFGVFACVFWGVSP